MKSTILTSFAIFALLGSGCRAVPSPTVPTSPATSTPPSVSTTPPTTTVVSVEPKAPVLVSKIKIARLHNLEEAPKPGQLIRGCDYVTFEEVSIPATTMPLTAAMKEIFQGSSDFGLKLTSVKLKDGLAQITFEGMPSLGGECDDERLPAIIEETAKQFPTVKKVQICQGKVIYNTSLKPEPDAPCPAL